MSLKSSDVILITGGTGSFGSAVIERLIDFDLQEIRIFSRDEKKQEDMRLKYKKKNLKFYIGDCRDYSSIKSAMNGVDLIFSAAALKQVPVCEFYPLEAVQTNILGTNNTLNAAIECGVKKVVVLSTDKAVYPINAMGMSKGLMEKVAIAKATSISSNNTIITVTRYGNVMGSRGSVIPLFIDQCQKNEPITITDPEMTRFMMSLNEAIDLVFFAFSNGGQGDLFVQKSPAATIADLAETIKDIFGSSSEIKIIGTRHGEKLYESLLSREEFLKAKDMGRFYKVQSDKRDLNYGLYFSEGHESKSLLGEYTSHNTERLSKPELKKLLLSLDFVKRALGA